MPELLDLRETRLLITGAASGIGRAASILIGRLGGRVVLVDMDENGLEHTMRALEGEGHVSLCADLRDVEKIPSWMGELTSTAGMLSGLIHAAGIQCIQPVRLLTPKSYRDALLVNTEAAIALVRAFQRKSNCSPEGGSIVFVSSVMAKVGSPGASAYGLTKSALIGLAKSLAVELAPRRIRVNCVVPGFVRTPMFDRVSSLWDSEQKAAVESEHPLGFGEPEDVANAIAFLIADTGRWVTGTELVVDGGYSAHQHIHSNAGVSMFVLVTGASSGIGRQIAVQLSESYQLILHGRDLERLEETRQMCQSPKQHMTWPMDLKETAGIEPSLRSLLSEIETGVQGFVHCAGALHVLPIRSTVPSIVEDIMNVNFASALEITRVLGSKKMNNKHLRNVVFVSSTASKFGAKGFGVYCASKGALDSLMRALAVELAPGVRVNSVLPGAIRTDMTDEMLNDPEIASRIQSQYPLGIGKASDIASAVEFLISDESRWVTGHQLVVDGGCTADISA